MCARWLGRSCSCPPPPQPGLPLVEMAIALEHSGEPLGPEGAALAGLKGGLWSRLTTPPLVPAGFSTLAQLKQRNTLKDGIIMIQTLLIILFIIVPIFLLLDKVIGGGGSLGGPQRRPLHRPGIGRVSISPALVVAILAQSVPRAGPLAHLFNHSFLPSFIQLFLQNAPHS